MNPHFRAMHRAEIQRQTVRRYELIAGIHAVPWLLGFITGLLILWPIACLPVLILAWWATRRLIHFSQRNIIGVALSGWWQHLLLFLGGLIPAALIVSGHGNPFISALPLLISAPLNYYNWTRHRRRLHMHVARDYLRELPGHSRAASFQPTTHRQGRIP